MACYGVTLNFKHFVAILLTSKFTFFCRFHRNRSFSYACKNLVLANGGSDLANRLGLRGEDKSISWLKYELPELEKTLNNLSMSERAKLKPVMIVGAGLSACDAVHICRNAGIKVIHVYRKQTAGLDKLLPENIYPEYFEVSFLSLTYFEDILV